MVAVLPVKRGISSYAVTNIPQEWSQQWFRYFIDSFLTGADIRNVVTPAGSGIVITGNVSGSTTTGSTANTTVTISQAPIANNTVLGNVSGGIAPPVGLSQAQLTALINIFTNSTSGAVPGSGGGTVNFLRADGTWASPATAVSANPTALVGPTAVNGTALTFMTSDSAPAINLAAAYIWAGVHTFSARIAANLGLTVSGGTFISRGITDSATAIALTIASTGDISIAVPASGVALTVNNAAGLYIQQWIDGSVIGGLASDGSNVNIGAVSNHGLGFFTNANTAALSISTTGNVVVHTPISGVAFTVNGNTSSVGDIVFSTNGKPYTYRGTTASTASGTPVTLQALPTLPFSSWIVTASLAGTNDATNNSAVAIVSVNGTAAKTTTIQTAGQLTITNSGLNVQATQTSGSPAVISYSILQIA